MRAEALSAEPFDGCPWGQGSPEFGPPERAGSVWVGSAAVGAGEGVSGVGEASPRRALEGLKPATVFKERCGGALAHGHSNGRLAARAGRREGCGPDA